MNDSKNKPAVTYDTDSLFYRNILKQARDIIFVVAPDGRIVETNQAAVDVYGYSLNELTNMRVQDLRPPEAVTVIDVLLEKAQREGSLFRSFHVRRNGTVFPVEVGSRRIRHANRDLVVSMVRDITETVSTETSLREKEERLRLLYEELMASHEELIATDEELRQQFSELLRKEEAIQKQNTILQSLHEMALGLMHRHDPEDLLRKIVKEATEFMGTAHGFIYLLDKAQNVFLRTHGTGIYESDIGRRIPSDQGNVGIVYRTGEPVIENDYRSWRKGSPASPQMEELCAILQVPLKSEGQVVGTIGLGYCEEGRAFGEAEVAGLNQFAELAAIAMDNALLVASYRKELTDRKQIEEALRQSEAKYRAIFEAASDGIGLYEVTRGKIIDVNRRACEICGYTKQEMVSDGLGMAGTGRSPYSVTEAREWFAKAVQGEPQLFEWRSKHKDGQLLWLEISLTRIRFGKRDCILAIFRDISERKNQEQAIRRMAYYDALTGLPNRAHLQERLAPELEKAGLGKAAGAILFVDIDDLKLINDTLGHSYGDGVIIKAGAYLFAEVEGEAMVARIGGDEFIVWLPGENLPGNIAAKADNMLRMLSRDYDIGAARTHMSASIGIALYPQDGTSIDEVFRKADLALYAAKESGKNSWRFYESRLQSSAQEKMLIKRGLREAIANGELSLVYQPLMDARSGQTVSFEALLRWTNPVYGSIQPSRFIPLAEESDTIHKIGAWVLQKACQFIRRLTIMGYEEIRVSVNVSPRQLAADDFVAIVCEAIHAAQIEPGQLEIEITEHTFISSMKDSRDTLTRIRELGVHLSLDDFGTGYSSLTYLRHLPVEILKIDKSFIDNIVSDEEQLQLICSIINMAHVLKKQVVAEGVETEEQLEKLRECQCDFIQGYVFGRPVHDKEAIRMLAQGR